MWVDAEQLAATDRRCLTIYTSRGNRKCDVAKTVAERRRCEFGVHRNNLFATLQKAVENREAVFVEFFKQSQAAS
jgi:predicted nucleic acid-binding OB-fold protein